MTPSQRSAIDGPIIRTAEGYRAHAERLLAAAAETQDPDSVLALQALVREWRKLAVEADWQEAMLTALATAEAAITTAATPGGHSADRPFQLRASGASEHPE